MNVGYWSAHCEAWFLKRQAEIDAGTAKLRTPAEWKSALRYEATTLLLVLANEEAAKRLVDTWL